MITNRDFELWAFGQEMDMNSSYGEYINKWNSKNSHIMIFSENLYDFPGKFTLISKLFRELYQPERLSEKTPQGDATV